MIKDKNDPMNQAGIAFSLEQMIPNQSKLNAKKVTSVRWLKLKQKNGQKRVEARSKNSILQSFCNRKENNSF